MTVTAEITSDTIGERLVAAGKISQTDVGKALTFQQEMGKAMHGAAALTTLRPASGRLGAVLVRMGALSEEALLPELSEQTDISLLASDALPDSAAVAEAVPLLASTTSCWQGREAVPFMRANQLLIAAKNPLERELNELVAHAAGARTAQLFGQTNCFLMAVRFSFLTPRFLSLIGDKGRHLRYVQHRIGARERRKLWFLCLAQGLSKISRKMGVLSAANTCP
jgi:hypothetical protein